MTKEEFIGTKEQRKVRIGGSEFGTVIEVNPYQKRAELAMIKAGVIANTFEGNEATRRGEALENDIIAMFEDDTGLSVTGEQKEFTKKPENCLELVCHVDGITSDNAVFEAKTTDITSKTWKDGIPEYYKAQLEFNCMLSGLNKAYIAVGYCKGNEIAKFDWFEYVPQMVAEDIIKSCQIFTAQVEDFKRFGVVNNGKIIKSDISDNLIEKLSELNEKISEMKKEIKPLEDEKKLIEDKLKKEIGNNLGFETELFKVTMANRVISPTHEFKITRSGLKIEYK